MLLFFCRTITADYGYFVRIDFRDFFRIEPASNEGNCDYDYLEVFPINTNYSRTNNKNTKRYKTKKGLEPKRQNKAKTKGQRDVKRKKYKMTYATNARDTASLIARILIVEWTSVSYDDLEKGGSKSDLMWKGQCSSEAILIRAKQPTTEAFQVNE